MHISSKHHYNIITYVKGLTLKKKKKKAKGYKIRQMSYLSLCQLVLRGEFILFNMTLEPQYI